MAASPLGSVLTLLVLLALGAREVQLRMDRLAARILLAVAGRPSKIGGVLTGLAAVNLAELVLCAAIGWFQLANKELRAAAFYLLLIKAALVRLPAVWFPDGLEDAAGLAAILWLAFGHWLGSGTDASVSDTEICGILAATEAGLKQLQGVLMWERVDLWVAAAAAIYLLGCLCLIGWLLVRGFSALLSWAPRPLVPLSLVCLLSLLAWLSLGFRSDVDHMSRGDRSLDRDPGQMILRPSFQLAVPSVLPFHAVGTPFCAPPINLSTERTNHISSSEPPRTNHTSTSSKPRTNHTSSSAKPRSNHISSSELHLEIIFPAYPATTVPISKKYWINVDPSRVPVARARGGTLPRGSDDGYYYSYYVGSFYALLVRLYNYARRMLLPRCCLELMMFGEAR